MTPQEFIRKWKPVALTERAAAHTHFNNLCALVGHDDPVAAPCRVAVIWPCSAFSAST